MPVQIGFTVRDPRNGKRINVRQALVAVRPANGWKYVTHINGIKQTLNGVSAIDVRKKTKELLLRNRKEWCEDDFWVDANLQWMSKTPTRRHKIPVEIISDLRKEEAPLMEEEWDWFETAGGFVGLVLAKDDYDPLEFIAVLGIIRDMADRRRNPSTANQRHSIMVSGVSWLSNNTPMTRLEARKWWFKFYNSERRRLGKSPTSYTSYSRTNHWI